MTVQPKELMFALLYMKKLDDRPVGFLKVSPKHPVCPLVVGCCKIALVITFFFR